MSTISKLNNTSLQWKLITIHGSWHPTKNPREASSEAGKRTWAPSDSVISGQAVATRSDVGLVPANGGGPWRPMAPVGVRGVGQEEPNLTADLIQGIATDPLWIRTFDLLQLPVCECNRILYSCM